MANPKVKIPKSVRKKMHEMAMRPIRSSAESIAAACNAESSWGFYKAYHADDASRVVALNANAESHRANRILFLSDRGRI